MLEDDDEDEDDDDDDVSLSAPTRTRPAPPPVPVGYSSSTSTSSATAGIGNRFDGLNLGDVTLQQGTEAARNDTATGGQPQGGEDALTGGYDSAREFPLSLERKTALTGADLGKFNSPSKTQTTATSRPPPPPPRPPSLPPASPRTLTRSALRSLYTLRRSRTRIRTRIRTLTTSRKCNISANRLPVGKKGCMRRKKMAGIRLRRRVKPRRKRMGNPSTTTTTTTTTTRKLGLFGRRHPRRRRRRRRYRARTPRGGRLNPNPSCGLPRPAAS